MKFDELSGQQTIRVSEDIFEEVTAAVNKVFKNSDQNNLTNSQVATFSIAVGYQNDRKLDNSPPTKPLKLDSLDSNQVLRTLIEDRHEDANPEELQSILQKYLEGGTQTLYESIENGYISYSEYFDTHPSMPFPE